MRKFTIGKTVRKAARRFMPVLMIPPLLVLAGCDTAEPDMGQLWQSAVADAVFSGDDEVMELVTLTPNNPEVIWDEAGERVLLLTWHDYDDACTPGSRMPSGVGDI